MEKGGAWSVRRVKIARSQRKTWFIPAVTYIYENLKLLLGIFVLENCLPCIQIQLLSSSNSPFI